MKRSVIGICLLLSILLTILTGCTSESNEFTPCAKCGNRATTTISGPEYILQQNGIPISKCKKVTSNVYTAYVCNSCVGRVADPAY